MTSTSIDPREAAHFDAMAADWWNPRGSSAPLHKVNPVRLSFIREVALRHFGRDGHARCWLDGLDILDIGCGGGILAEPLARLGGKVTAIDGAAAAIGVARSHAELGGLAIDYRVGAVEDLAQGGAQYDLITCMEVVEHVADVAAFLGAIATLLRPGGLLVYSTPNRTTLSYAAMIVGAEWVLRILPRGTHDWKRFLTPEEMRAALAAVGLDASPPRGISLRPGHGFRLSGDLRVNYIGTATR